MVYLVSLLSSTSPPFDFQLKRYIFEKLYKEESAFLYFFA